MTKADNPTFVLFEKSKKKSYSLEVLLEDKKISFQAKENSDMLPERYKSEYSLELLLNETKVFSEFKSIKEVKVSLVELFSQKLPEVNDKGSFLYLSFRLNQKEVNLKLYHYIVVEEQLKSISLCIKKLKKFYYTQSELMHKFMNQFQLLLRLSSSLSKKNKWLAERKMLLEEENEKLEKQTKAKKKGDSISDLNEIRAINAHEDDIRCMCLIDRKRFASCSPDTTIKIFNLQSYQCERTLKGHTSKVNYISLLSNGALISCSQDGKIKIWEKVGGQYQNRRTLSNHSGYVTKACEISRDRICSCSFDQTLIIWKRNSTYDYLKTLKGHNSYIHTFIELKNKRYIVSICRNRGNNAGFELRCWSNEDYECEKTTYDIDFCLWSNTNMVESNNNQIIIGGMNNSVIVIDSITFMISRITFKDIGGILSLVILPDNTLLCGCENVDLIEVNVGKRKVVNIKQNAHTPYVNCLMLMNDVLISSSNSIIKFWNWEL